MPVGEKTKMLWKNPEYRKKMLEQHHKFGFGDNNPMRSENVKIKIRKALTGKKLSEEHKRSLRKSKSTTIKMKKPKSELAKKNMSLARKGVMIREKAPNWQGGISFEVYPYEWTDDLKESIRKRDNYICQECGLHQNELVGRTKKLDVHHIDYDKNNLAPDNFVTLCRGCHIKTNYNREYWVKYFLNEQ
jgi:heterodisulfide reductase subunit B